MLLDDEVPGAKDVTRVISTASKTPTIATQPEVAIATTTEDSTSFN